MRRVLRQCKRFFEGGGGTYSPSKEPLDGRYAELVSCCGVWCNDAAMLLPAHPTEEQINDGMAGVLCRCTGHIKVKEAIRNVAGYPRR